MDGINRVVAISTSWLTHTQTDPLLSRVIVDLADVRDISESGQPSEVVSSWEVLPGRWWFIQFFESSLFVARLETVAGVLLVARFLELLEETVSCNESLLRVLMILRLFCLCGGRDMMVGFRIE